MSNHENLSVTVTWEGSLPKKRRVSRARSCDGGGDATNSSIPTSSDQLDNNYEQRMLSRNNNAAPGQQSSSSSTHRRRHRKKRKHNKGTLRAGEEKRKAVMNPDRSKLLVYKSPVRVLMEISAMRRWGTPIFECCSIVGPPHNRRFTFRVSVNGVTYQMLKSSSSKKAAKEEAAKFCLRKLEPTSN